MAIMIIEFISNINIFFQKKDLIKNLKKYGKIIGVFLIGLILAISINKGVRVALKFEPIENVKSISFIHYLAMGQNNETLGAYSQQDVNESIQYGNKDDLKKFVNRLEERSVLQNIEFFAKKTLLNFNDGSFSWGLDGVFFYEIPERESVFSNKLEEVYIGSGRYYDYFIQYKNFLWLFVLIFVPFIIKKKNDKNELVIMTALIGITLFITLFEPRTRYLYCYAPLFVVCFTLGINNLKKRISNLKKYLKKTKN